MSVFRTAQRRSFPNRVVRDGWCTGRTLRSCRVKTYRMSPQGRTLAALRALTTGIVGWVPKNAAPTLRNARGLTNEEYLALMLNSGRLEARDLAR